MRDLTRFIIIIAFFIVFMSKIVSNRLWFCRLSGSFEHGFFTSRSGPLALHFHSTASGKACERKPEGKAIQPQVLVSVVRSVSNSVTVSGEVVNGARVPLSTKGDRVLDVIAASAGIMDRYGALYTPQPSWTTGSSLALRVIVCGRFSAPKFRAH